MKPDKIYEGRSTIQMYNCDCMELIEGKPENHWDLAICDPEYGLGEAQGQEKSRNQCNGRAQTEVKYKIKDWDNDSIGKGILDKIVEVSKNQVVFGANHFISKIPIDSSCWIVWDKDNTGDFADCELAWTSFDTAVKKFTHRWNGMLQHNMKNKQKRIHPTEKPIRLYRWLLKNYAEEEHTILDTHGGSMSLAIACWEEGFDLDICELDEDYFNDAVQRFENHISQKQLF